MTHNVTEGPKRYQPRVWGCPPTPPPSEPSHRVAPLSFANLGLVVAFAVVCTKMGHLRGIAVLLAAARSGRNDRQAVPKM